jgi:hypothetical protein
MPEHIFFVCLSLDLDRDTRFDLAKSGIIGKILMSRAQGRPLKNFKVLLYIFN